MKKLIPFLLLLVACQKEIQPIPTTESITVTSDAAAFEGEVYGERDFGLNSDAAMILSRTLGNTNNLFIGNSLFNQMDNHILFPEYATFNRAYGGALAEHCLYYKDDLGIDYAQNLFLYFGENEYLANWRPWTMAPNLQYLITYWHDRNPNLKIIFCKMQACPSLWIDSQHGNWQIDGFNNQMVAFAQSRPWMSVADLNVATKTWASGVAQPLTQCYKMEASSAAWSEDGYQQVHLNALGYAIWKQVLMPYLLK